MNRRRLFAAILEFKAPNSSLFWSHSYGGFGLQTAGRGNRSAAVCWADDDYTRLSL